MSRKRDIIVTAVVTAAVVFAACAVAYFTVLPKAGKLARAEEILARHYINTPDEAGRASMEDAAIGAMVLSLGDPYSAYMNQEVYADYQEDQKDAYIGLGISVVFDAETEELTVVAPYDGSPAQKAGVMPMDKIVEVDGVRTSRETYNGIIDHLKGEGLKPGEAVSVTVDRNGESLTFSIERAEIAMQTVTFRMLEDGIAYIRISEFRNNTYEDYLDALEKVSRENAKGLVIDLRNNPGGYAHAVLAITDTLAPKGSLIAYSLKNDGTRTDYRATEEALGLPIAVLVNEGSASASELLAGSVQALGVGKLVGTKTFGKAVGQSSYPLGDGTNIYLTDARFYTPLGNCIDGIGLTPDVPVSLSDEKQKNLLLLSPEEDPQLQAGIAVLREEMSEP